MANKLQDKEKVTVGELDISQFYKMLYFEECS